MDHVVLQNALWFQHGTSMQSSLLTALCHIMPYYALHCCILVYNLELERHLGGMAIVSKKVGIVKKRAAGLDNFYVQQ